MVPVSIDPSLGGRPASKWARPVQRAEGLSVAVRTPHRGLILPEAWGSFRDGMFGQVWKDTESREEIPGRRSCGCNYQSRRSA